MRVFENILNIPQDTHDVEITHTPMEYLYLNYDSETIWVML